MKVQEFINKVGRVDNVNAIKNILTIKEYLPFLEKKELANRIIEKSIVRENNFIKINEINKYLNFTIEVLSAYTDLEFDSDMDVAASEYDMLVQNNKLGSLIDLLKDEYKVVLDLTEMAADYYMQQNNINYQISVLFNGLNSIVNKLGDALLSKVNNFDLKSFGISENDIVKLNSFLNTYNI